MIESNLPVQQPCTSIDFLSHISISEAYSTIMNIPPLPKLLLAWCSTLLSALSNQDNRIDQLHEYYLLELSRLYFNSQQLTKCLLILLSSPNFVEFDSSPQNTSPHRQALSLIMQFLQRRNVLNRLHWETITDIELNRPLRVKIFQFLQFYAKNKDKKRQDTTRKEHEKEEEFDNQEDLSDGQQEHEESLEGQVEGKDEKGELDQEEDEKSEEKRQSELLRYGWLKYLGRQPWSTWHCLIRSRIYHPAISLLSLLFKRAFSISPLPLNCICLFQQYSQFLAQQLPIMHDPLQQTHRLCFEQSFQEMVRSRSLRMNPRLWALAMKQVKQLVSLIRYSSPELRTLNWELYGSMATGLALQVESDADINLVLGEGGEMPRQEQLEWLKKIYESLDQGEKLEGRLGKPLKFKFYCSPRIKLPFLKLRIFHNPHGPKNSLRILRSFDIIVNNTEAVRHVMLFRPYLQSGRIARFLMLVKIWGKRRNIINVFQHIYCYSSHFISIMAAFYLICAGYAPYLKEEERQFVLTSPLIPDNQLPSIAELFRGFLNFYRRDGQFNKQNLTISLVKDCPPWNEEGANLSALNWSLSLVRIYDCVTKTNRGKIEHKHKENFYKQVEDTLIKVENQASIEQIIYLPSQDL